MNRSEMSDLSINIRHTEIDLETYAAAQRHLS